MRPVRAAAAEARAALTADLAAVSAAGIASRSALRCSVLSHWFWSVSNPGYEVWVDNEAMSAAEACGPCGEGAYHWSTV